MGTSTLADAFSLEGRVALVTGAGRGIGRETARVLAAAGAEVWMMSRTASDLAGAVADIAAEGGRARPLVCDVTDSTALRAAIDGLPSLDVFVNNAGTNIPEPFVDVSEDHLDRLLDLNVRAAFVAAQVAVRKMLAAPDRKARGGSVVNMSSQMGHIGAPNRSVYCLSKHAIEGLTKAMALELAPHGIRVNAIAPTFVETPMTRPMFERPAFAQYVNERIPLGRVGRTSEVAHSILYLAAPASSLMTGASLVVDGGWTAQ